MLNSLLKALEERRYASIDPETGELRLYLHPQTESVVGLLLEPESLGGEI